MCRRSSVIHFVLSGMEHVTVYWECEGYKTNVGPVKHYNSIIEYKQRVM